MKNVIIADILHLVNHKMMNIHLSNFKTKHSTYPINIYNIFWSRLTADNKENHINTNLLLSDISV